MIGGDYTKLGSANAALLWDDPLVMQRCIPAVVDSCVSRSLRLYRCDDDDLGGGCNSQTQSGAFTNNVRLATQRGHLRACAHATAAAAAAASAAPARHRHTTVPASGRFVSMVLGPRACRRQQVGRVHSKAQRSSSTPGTYVKTHLKCSIMNLRDPRDTAVFCVCLRVHPLRTKSTTNKTTTTTTRLQDQLAADYYPRSRAFAPAAVASIPCRPITIKRKNGLLRFNLKVQSKTKI